MTARQDDKGRWLRTGEGQRKDGRYYFKYTDINGQTKFKYSWKLTQSDRVPLNKSDCEALRDIERKVVKDLNDEISSDGARISMMELYDEYVGLREQGKANNTQLTYKQKRRMIENDQLGRMAINKINRSKAMAMIRRLSDRGYAYSTMVDFRSTMKSCFNLAVQDLYIRVNPFDFRISDVLKNDTKKVEALTESQVEHLLEFVKNDNTSRKYYNMLVLFLETGLRASEMCGLTVKDVDLRHHALNINHQLLYNSTNGYYISGLKTDNAYRQIPLSTRGFEAIKGALAQRQPSSFEIDGYKDFLFTTVKDAMPMHTTVVNNFLVRVERKYNKHNDDQLPHLHAHLLRHTFCSLCAQKKMNVKILSKLMGHSTINITLDVYTDIPQENIKKEVAEILG